MDCLPLELLVEIFSELSKGELLVAKSVCKAWYHFISVDHLVWRVVCMKKWVGRCNVAFYGGSWKRMLLDDNLKTKALEWEWDTRRCGSGIHTFHNNRAAVFQAASYQACQVLCTRPCIGEEKYYIEFEVIHTIRRPLILVSLEKMQMWNIDVVLTTMVGLLAYLVVRYFTIKLGPPIRSKITS